MAKNQKSWGATPAEWKHLSVVLKLQADLLPVVSNPKARISPHSKLVALGKTPSRLDMFGLAAGIKGWTSLQATLADITSWAKNPDHGICIQTRDVRALDIDIADESAAREVVAMCEMLVGALPMRRRENSGKCLFAFHMPGVFPKRSFKTAHGLVEFLGTGQQFIALGTHPSGARYEWAGGLPTEIPTLEPDEFNALWDALVARFAVEPELRAGGTGVRAALRPRTAEDAEADPTGEWLREQGLVLDEDRSGRLDVVCPWQAEHTSDSGPSQTSYFPPGVGGVGRAGWRCMHAHCAHRTLADYLREVGYEDSLFEDVSGGAAGSAPEPVEGGVAVVDPFADQGEWPREIRRNTKTGEIETSATAVQAVLRRPDLCNVQIGYDEFKADIMVAWRGDPGWRPLKDTDYFTLRVVLEQRGFKAPGTDIMREAVAKVAELNSFDSATQWVQGLRWDGVPRVAGFMHRYFGTEDSPYATAVSEYLWSALAGRALVPGVKVDMVPVLYGTQGTGKTTGVAAIAPEPDAFVELSLDVRDDDLARKMRGALVGELGELRGLAGKDADVIKQWISRTHEEWTPKYKERKIKFARRLVMVGTINRDDFLDDETGARRWLPITTGAVQVTLIERDRDQLWAEGAVLFTAEGVHWRAAQTLAKDEHAAFGATDEWDEAVRAWVARDDIEGAPRGVDGIKLSDVLTSALGFNLGKTTRSEQMRAAKVMVRLGYVKVQRRLDGVVSRVWVAAG